jgi:hypothetical protein
LSNKNQEECREEKGERKRIGDEGVKNNSELIMRENKIKLVQNKTSKKKEKTTQYFFLAGETEDEDVSLLFQALCLVVYFLRVCVCVCVCVLQEVKPRTSLSSSSKKETLGCQIGTQHFYTSK